MRTLHLHFLRHTSLYPEQKLYTSFIKISYPILAFKQQKFIPETVIVSPQLAYNKNTTTVYIDLSTVYINLHRSLYKLRHGIQNRYKYINKNKHLITPFRRNNNEYSSTL